MIYVIDHKDSFTHNVVHQLSLFDDVNVMTLVKLINRN
jgi:anthranilate/para-aminobenzoate synthase component II